MAPRKNAPQLVSAQVTPKKRTQSGTPASSQGESSAKPAVASKARKPPKEDAELKALALKANPAGVRIINTNLENSKAVMAGYLFLPDTNALAQFMNRDGKALITAVIRPMLMPYQTTCACSKNSQRVGEMVSASSAETPTRLGAAKASSTVSKVLYQPTRHFSTIPPSQSDITKSRAPP